MSDSLETLSGIRTVKRLSGLDQAKSALKGVRTGATGRGREAKAQVRKQERVAETELATATDELARKQAGIKRGGRSSLIRSQAGLATNLAGTA